MVVIEKKAGIIHFDGVFKKKKMCIKHSVCVSFQCTGYSSIIWLAHLYLKIYAYLYINYMYIHM